MKLINRCRFLLIALFAFLNPFKLFAQDAPKLKYIVLDFYADWCGPCVSMKQRVWNNDSVKKELENFDFYEIDIDTDKKYPKIYGVQSIPCVVMVSYDGSKYKEVKRFVGARTIGFVLNWLKAK